MPHFVSPVVARGTLSGRAQPSIAGSVVGLRPWAFGDVPTLVTAYADPDIQRWHSRSLDEQEAQALVDSWHTGWRTETKAEWAVTDTSTGDVVGRVGLRSVDLANGEAEIAYWVLPTAREQHIATTAVNTLCRWAFETVGLHRLELRHSTRNAASCRVASSAGFTLEGTLRSAAEHSDGWHDMHLHSRVATDRLEGVPPTRAARPADAPQTNSMPPSTRTDCPVM